MSEPTATDTTVDDMTPVAPGTPSGGHGFWRRLRRDRAAMISLCFLAIIAAASLLAPIIAPFDPDRDGTLAEALDGPSLSHLLGADDLGRDVLTRILYAGRVSLGSALLAVAVASVLGFPLGLLAGFRGGRVDSIVMRVNDTLMSFPPLVLAISIVGMLGTSLVNAMIAIGIVYAPRFMRVMRAAVLSIREEAYVEAAIMMGSPGVRTARRHILPNVLSPLFVEITLSLGFAILAEASLSFVGLGVQPPTASWGSMLDAAFTYMDRAPVYALAPGVMIFLVVLSLNTLGDGLRDSLGREERR